jgi:Ca-activated chloride channel family protein
LTNDVETIRSQLDALTTDIMPAQGNNPVVGIQKAVQLMKQAGMPQGDILLLTDSIKTAETPVLIENLEQYHLSILGVGTTEGAPIALPNGGFAKDEQGQILVPKLQVTPLQNLAALGHGHYETLAADNSDIDGLAHVFERPLTDANQTEKTDVWVEQWEDNGIWLILFILPWAAWQFRKGVIFVMAFCCIPMPHNAEAFELRDLWRTPNQQGQRAFDKGLYEKAAEKFDDTQWKGAAYYKMGHYDDAIKAFQEGHNFYNLGNALVKKGMLKDALDAYQQAINDNPSNKDATFNKELIERELAKQQSQSNTSDQQSPKASNQTQSDSNNNPEASSDSNPNASESQSMSKPEHQAGDNPPIQKTDEAKKAQSNDSKMSEQSRHEESQQVPDNNPDTKVTSQDTERFDEQIQANEQWLKRIPDDPSVLLKRKFKYQYSQQQQ